MFLESLVLLQQFLILLLVLDLLDQQFLEFELALNQFLLDIPENSGINHPFSSILIDLGPFLLHILSNSICLTVQLPKVVFVLFVSVLQTR